jgi:multisubunit Na+/H+ antiporter MnhG subunit
MSVLHRTDPHVPTCRDTDFIVSQAIAGRTDFIFPVSLTRAVLLILCLFLLTSTFASAFAKTDKRKGHLPNRQLTRAEVKEAEGRLVEMG